jgi:ribonuclease HI
MQQPTVVPPWWQAPVTIIDEDPKTAISKHDQLMASRTHKDMVVYTDGSDIGGRVGAAAWCADNGWKLQSYLGTPGWCTVYGAELTGIWQALVMALRRGSAIKAITIFADNQAAIQSTGRPGTQSGQYILRRIVNSIDLLHRRGVYVELRWIPAHVGVQGNENVDKLAKKTTGWRLKGGAGAGKKGSFQCYNMALQATCKRDIRAHMRSEWQRIWATQQQSGAAYRRAFGSYLDKTVNKLHSGLPKALSSILIQMRTGKIGLNDYLHKIKKADLPGCPCGMANHTVAHILCDCSFYRRQRKHYLGSIVIRDLTSILNNPKTSVKAANFMLATGLLDQFSHYRFRTQLGEE